MIKFIKHDDYAKLSDRIYVTGNLSRPTDYKQLNSEEEIEIAVNHTKDYYPEVPHLHKWNSEYNYVVSGGGKANGHQ